MAGTYRFTPDGVEIRNGRIEGTLPRAQVTSAAETQSLFSIAFGREVRILIPKRLLGGGRMPAAAGLALLREERGIIWIRHIHSPGAPFPGTRRGYYLSCRSDTGRIYPVPGAPGFRERVRPSGSARRSW